HERHGGEPQHPAGDEHVDAGRVRERSGDQDPVRDHDELALRAQLQRQVVGGRARVEGDRLAVADQLRRLAGDCALAVDFEAEAEVEAELRVATVERPHAAAHARDEPLARELGEVAADGDLGNRKRLRKFRNLNGIAGLEHLQHLLHALVLRQTGQIVRRSGILRQAAASLFLSCGVCQALRRAFETSDNENHSLTTTTSNRRGPCTPSIRWNSMSAVADGPEMKVTGRRVVRNPCAICRIAAGTPSTTWPARSTHTWTSGTRLRTRRPCPSPASSTIVPVSAM